jgi:ATP-dependent Lon protease
MSGSILCFVGPPGTGKTSIGKSIARALGRKYIRVALGGVRDEAEIRGHRRTYIGSLPGRIINALRKAGSNNPVFMLDEVDKLGADFRGDPASALLEVLDPEQNFSYTDHYLEVPFDLSKVLFICTANFLDPVPPALKDRMEVLEFPGYTEEEKLQIARRYLVPQQVESNGLTAEQFQITDDAVRRLIGEYTREAGVRNLERQIASLCRKVAKTIALDGAASRTVGVDDVTELLGPAKFIREVAERMDEPGVAAGLAWTPTGGDIIFIESTMTPGDGKLTLTGMLGDVMKESAQAALTYVRAHAEEFGADPKVFGENDFHIHVPAGAIPKDGPSAGVTMAVALASLCSGRKVRHNVAMTGEITLRGKVLPVGGIKEKILAARRAGIDTVIVPEQNEKDLQKLPDYAKDTLEFHPVDKVEDILPIALEKPAARKRKRSKKK